METRRRSVFIVHVGSASSKVEHTKVRLKTPREKQTKWPPGLLRCPRGGVCKAVAARGWPWGGGACSQEGFESPSVTLWPCAKAVYSEEHDGRSRAAWGVRALLVQGPATKAGLCFSRRQRRLSLLSTAISSVDLHGMFAAFGNGGNPPAMHPMVLLLVSRESLLTADLATG